MRSARGWWVVVLGGLAGCGGKVASEGEVALGVEPEPSGNVDGVESRVAAGGAHTCVIVASGAVRCFGNGGSGQLGNGALLSRDRPVSVEGLTNAKQIVAGSAFTCARLANGTVRCFGNNEGGQLGDGTRTSRATPVRVRSLTEVVEIAAGAYHACARTKNGRVHCWGLGTHGQLGDGTIEDRSIPVTIVLPPAVAIAAGWTHSCAILEDHTVWCWGANNRGQLGDGSSIDRPRPAKVSGTTGDPVAIALGEDHSCVRTEAGAMQCWGRNFDGQLGDGTDLVRRSAIVVPLSGVSAIDLGRAHTCAIHDGGASCWGANRLGQLGIGTITPTPARRPRPVLDSGEFLTISAGADHTCAEVPRGRVACFGEGTDGRLGNGDESDRSAPVVITP